MRVPAGLSFLILLGLGLHYASLTLDDVFISFRYAQNLVDGNGLTFNPGERIEGYSNLLFTLLLAGGAALGLPLVWTAKALNLAAGLGVIGLVVSWPAGTRRVRLVAAFMIAVSQSFALWSAIGMETMVYTFLIVWASWLLVRSMSPPARPRVATDVYLDRGAQDGFRVASAFVFGLVAITRPEGGVLVLPALWILVRKRTDRASLVLPILAYLAPVIGQFVFRGIYYGSLLPATYAAKVGWDPALIWHAMRYQLVPFLYGHLTPFIVFALAPRPRWFRLIAPTDATAVLFWGHLVLLAVFSCLAGKDWMPAYRFLVPALPGGMWLLATVLDRALARAAGGLRAVTLAVFVVFVFALSWIKTAPQAREFGHRSWWSQPTLDWRAGLDDDRVAMLDWLQRSASPGDDLATGEAGLLVWQTGVYLIDTWGLLTPDIGLMIRSPVLPGVMVRYGSGRPGNQIAAYVARERPRFLITDVEETGGKAPPTVLEGAYALKKRMGRFLGYERVGRR